MAPELDWLLSLSEEGFRCTFRGSAVRRTKWRGLVRNACIAAGNASGRPGGLREPENTRLRVRLEGLACSDDAMIAEHARWALARFDRAPAASARGQALT
jgi:epoxyqueuosine reductase